MSKPKGRKNVVQIPRPFPETYDREEYASFVSGLTAGEGSFMLTISHSSGYFAAYARFNIKMRADDAELLYEVQSFFGCGQIYFTPPCKNARENAKPTFEYSVTDYKVIQNVIIPHFERYTMKSAKKMRDFTIWKRGVEFIAEIRSRPLPTLSRKGLRRTNQMGFGSRWNDADRATYESLVNELKAVRKYDSGIKKVVLPKVFATPEPVDQRCLFD